MRVVVPAAGIVALRQTAKGVVKVLLVYRPKLDDWVLPKGHVEAGELEPVTAYREFHEETGYRAAVRRPISQVEYPVDETTKRVYWFAGRLDAVPPSGVYNPAEVSKVVWCKLKKAQKKLSYANEREVLSQAAKMTPTVPLIIVRHAKAENALMWESDDMVRPLCDRGQRQAKHMVELLAAYGVKYLAASPATRCVQTLRPYADSTGLAIKQVDLLSEDGVYEDPEGVAHLAGTLLTKVAGGTPAAVCTHGPVLPTLVSALKSKVPYTAMKPGEAWVAYVEVGTGQVVAVDRYLSPD